MSVVCIFIMVCMVLILVPGGKRKQGRFIPPKFESKTVLGAPTVDDRLGWSEIYQEGMSFKAYVCGNIIVDNKSADVYFTNVSDNTVWMKLRIIDENENILAETGLLKPDEYVKSIVFNIDPLEGIKIKLKIMAYEPFTYYSAGAVTLNTTISKGGG